MASKTILSTLNSFKLLKLCSFLDGWVVYFKKSVFNTYFWCFPSFSFSVVVLLAPKITEWLVPKGLSLWILSLEMVVFLSQSTRSCQSDAEQWKKRSNRYLLAVCSLSPGIFIFNIFPFVTTIPDPYRHIQMFLLPKRCLTLFPAFLQPPAIVQNF